MVRHFDGSRVLRIFDRYEADLSGLIRAVPEPKYYVTGVDASRSKVSLAIEDSTLSQSGKLHVAMKSMIWLQAVAATMIHPPLSYLDTLVWCPCH
jgi:hypothetical protein